MCIRAVMFSAVLSSVLLLGCTSINHDTNATKTAPAAPSQDEMLGLLNSGKYDELDRRYSALQHAYKSNIISDEDLRNAFRVFYSPDPTLDDEYSAWVKAFPKSYVSHLARGIYYRKIGEDRRGGKFMSETYDEQLHGMEVSFHSAVDDLKTSTSLDNKPLLSYANLMTISSFLGQPKESRRLLELAVKTDPHNFVVREKYMGTLQTRWGGSVAEMAAFLEKCRTAGLSDEHLHTLESFVVEDRGWVYEYQNNNYEAALDEYIKAAKLSTDNDCLQCDAERFIDHKHYKEAITIESVILEGNPNAVKALGNRGFSYLQLDRPQEAVADLEHAAELNDAYSEDLLGRMYLIGTSVARDREKAIKYLSRAATQGYRPAQELLPMAMHPNMSPLPSPDSAKP